MSSKGWEVQGLIIFSAALISGCGEDKGKLSIQEQEQIFGRMCSEIMSTRNFESSLRMRIYNEAMEKAGRDINYGSNPALAVTLIEHNFKFFGCDYRDYIE